MAHAHSLICLIYCPERKNKPKPPRKTAAQKQFPNKRFQP